MEIKIVQGGRTLPTYHHNGQDFAEAPPEGAYEIRLKNTTFARRLAVLSVDGVNVISGQDAGFDGPGYVLRPGETIHIKGWRRSDDTVAKFTFQPQEGSYANRTGRGTQNTGIIGVAVFAEAQPPVTLSHFFTGVSTNQPHTTLGLGTDTVSASIPLSSTMDTLASTVPTSTTVPTSAPLPGIRSTIRRRRESESEPVAPQIRRRRESESVDLGTGYGKETKMHTETTSFNRASDQPALVLTLRYGVRAKLIEWGVPVVEHQQSPQPFPASVSVPPPPGWRAAR